MFARWFKGARERVPALRLVISNDSGYQAALARLKLENLDNNILGEEFPESMITVSGSRDHLASPTAEEIACDKWTSLSLIRAKAEMSQSKSGLYPPRDRDGHSRRFVSFRAQ